MSRTSRRVSNSGPGTGDGSAFVAAIDASGLLVSPSADEFDQAMDGGLYRDVVTQVSAAGNYVSLRSCRGEASFRCATGWAYITGNAGDAEMHGGLLGEADDLHLLDSRFFVASQNSSGPQAPPTAWLIDSVSGKAATLRWLDEPTTLNAPEQALPLCQLPGVGCAEVHGPDIGLPTIVDARDGTIRPLAVPEHAAPGLTVAQLGDGRIWVGTAPDDGQLGLAYSDDGGASWTEVALPIDVTSEDLPWTGSSDRLLEVAADGDRVAVAFSWGWGHEAERDRLYLSDDAGRSWTTISLEPRGNGARLYVVADGRLVLEWGMDNHPAEVLVSTGSDWTELENADIDFLDPSSLSGSQRFRVNSAGIALMPSFVVDDSAGFEVLDRTDFSADLTNWRTIESPRRLIDRFDGAIEASGVLARPSTDEIEQAWSGLYRDVQTQVSATGNYVTLRSCRDEETSRCVPAWAYITGNSGRVDDRVGPGVLGDGDHFDLHLLDDRYFVALETSPDAQVPATAWLIDAASGTAGPLRWLDEPTTLNAPEQALLLCQESYNTECGVGGVPSVVDARDGTIRPLAIPDHVAAGLPVAQHGADRIWVTTKPDGDAVGLAYSDDGGASWTEVALPEPLIATIEASPESVTVAADGDRVAAASKWGGDIAGHTVYVSDDAGRSWTPAATPRPSGNTGHLYVLADGRLVLTWSQGAHPMQVLVSFGSEWAEFAQPPDEIFARIFFLAPEEHSSVSQRFDVNRAGIALVSSFVMSPGYDSERLNTTDFSTDLTTWQTIDSLDD